MKHFYNEDNFDNLLCTDFIILLGIFIPIIHHEKGINSTFFLETFFLFLEAFIFFLGNIFLQSIFIFQQLWEMDDYSSAITKENPTLGPGLDRNLFEERALEQPSSVLHRGEQDFGLFGDSSSMDDDTSSIRWIWIAELKKIVELGLMRNCWINLSTNLLKKFKYKLGKFG